MANNSKNRAVLGVFTLAMINVAAIVSLKNLPLTAGFGLGCIFFYSIASIIFFIPVALVSAELATGWPKKGGVYIWVKEALGPKWGFLAIWLQWIENVFWYPTILSFTGAAIAYIFNPELASNKYYTLAVILIIFWGCTLLNFFGMKASGLISTIGVIAGTLIPGIFIILLGAMWILKGNPSQISFDVKNIVPDMTNIRNVVFLTGVLLALGGMEMSAVHAQEVKDPKKDYPKAILLATIIIILLSVLGSVAISIVVPAEKINLVSGVMESFRDFFKGFHMEWFMPIIAFLTAAGAIAMTSTWIIGPSKGILATAEHGYLPPIFQKMNKHGVPVAILVTQGFILTTLSLVFLFMPTVSSSYWICTVLTSQLYLIMYILMFVSAIVLRYRKPDVPRAYKIPGGHFGMLAVAGAGLFGCISTIIIGFFPPSQLKTGNILFYEAFLFLGIFIMCGIPIIINLFRKPEWKNKLYAEE